MYDIIGDTHGDADALTRLLGELGYARDGGVWRHPERTAILLGDFVDRGPEIREVLEIARAMVEGGAALAVMGNHEFNMVAYQLEHATERGRYLREHSDKNFAQHKETLEQLPGAAHGEYSRWFQTLPMWLDLPGLRIVHACWDPQYIARIEKHRAHCGGFTDEFFHAACDESSGLFAAVEVVLKGKELPLPGGKSFKDKGGHTRYAVRAKWYEDPARGAGTYRDHAFSFREADRACIPTDALAQEVLSKAWPYPADEPPVFFGHFWMPPDLRPAPLAPNVACLDYSVARAGRLCAYRWNGERELRDDAFVSVACGA